jgi:hypothetical protein
MALISEKPKANGFCQVLFIGKNHFPWLLNPTDIEYIDSHNKQTY